MDKPTEKISVEEFRNQIRSELNESNKYLSSWLEALVNKSKPSLYNSRRPWLPKGREYLSFYETLYYVLNWYMQFKSYHFKEMGWKIDTAVVENIKDKLLLIIREALADEDMKQFHGFFNDYNFYPLSLYTAIDYKFQNITGAKVNNILDFGSGIGRQAFQWCSREDVNFFSIDAIESLYILQNDIYNLLFPEKLIEYFCNPQRFYNLDFHTMVNKLYHLPTWRLDLLPDRYFDLIICVQILQEVNEKTLRYLLEQFRRIVKEGGGFIYKRL